MFRLDRKCIVVRFPGPGGLPSRRQWPAHRGATGTVRPHCSEENTIRALMELALPKFNGLGDRPTHARKAWMVSTDSPASPDPVCSTDLVRSPSPCLDLDALSSDDAEESVKPRDILVTLQSILRQHDNKIALAVYDIIKIDLFFSS